MEPNIDLLVYQDLLKFKEIDQKRYLFDPVRKKPILLTPEELVRQLTIMYLHHEKGYPLGRFSVEKQIKLNQTIKRYDIVVYDKRGQPFVLVECKAPEIMLGADTAAQISRYNYVLQVPYLMITNGPQSYFFGLSDNADSFVSIPELPTNA